MQGIFGWNRLRRGRADTFLGRLARDRRGNTLAIMAAALIPFCGLVGGGIDVSRMYLTKTRLQHACDAGALAGRKQMGAGTWGTDDNAAAVQFFNANFATNSYGSTSRAPTYSENAGKVTGTASATLPMTLMRVLGKTQETLAVTCDAEMRLPNTDIMFVLDTTGSMGDTPAGDSVTKLDSLKTSVKCFYEIVARLDTDATCTTGTPSGGTGNQVQVRFGFMPYATNVNVGYLLPTSYFADSWNYQTRKANPPRTTTTTSAPSQTGGTYVNMDPRSWTNQYYNGGVTSTWCSSQAAPADSAPTAVSGEGQPTEFNTTGTNPRVTTWATYQHGYYYQYRRNYDSGTSRCYVQERQVFGDLRRTYSQNETTTTQFSDWRYAQLPVNVGLLKNGTSWNRSFSWPIGTDGADRTITWDGCIEERPTTRVTSYDPIPSDAYDLNIDLPPAPGNANSLWGPALQQLIYARDVRTNWNQLDLAAVDTTENYTQNIAYSCPTEAKKLQAWPDPDTFDTYIDSLAASGNTYHDIGLLWGARFASPTGIFGSENALTPQGGEIDRNIIFMTDGDPCTSVLNYNAYGVAWFDRRQTPANTVPTDGCTETGTLTQQVNARTEALCTAIKNKNITLWVITFGYVDPKTVTRLTACATNSRYYSASNAATLQSTFATIANQISQLRLTK